MNTKENAGEEKAKSWRLLERVLGRTRQVVDYRSDWRIHPDTDTSILLTFSKAGQLFFDVSNKDLKEFASHRRAFFVFLAGSHRDVFIVPAEELREQIKSHGLSASLKFGDYKLHLVRDYRGTYFRELPTLNLAQFLNQYAQLL